MKPGDKVTWTEIKPKGGGCFNMSTKQGRVVSVHDRLVIVQYRGRHLHKLKTQLRKEGQHTELTDFVKGMAEAVRP